MRFYWNKEEIEEMRAYEKVDEFFHTAFFQKMMDETCPPIEILGESYVVGGLLKECDPLRFETMRLEFIDYVWRSFIDGQDIAVPFLTCEKEE